MTETLIKRSGKRVILISPALLFSYEENVLDFPMITSKKDLPREYFREDFHMHLVFTAVKIMFCSLWSRMKGKFDKNTTSWFLSSSKNYIQ